MVASLKYYYVRNVQDKAEQRAFCYLAGRSIKPGMLTEFRYQLRRRFRCGYMPGSRARSQCPAVRNFHKIPQKASFKPRESIIYLFRNVKRFQKLFWLRSWCGLDT